MTQSKLLVGIVLVLFLPGLGWAASPYEVVRRGNALYQEEKYEEASQQYTTAAQKLPKAAEIPFNQGNTSYKQQDYAKALEHYARALQSTDPRLESRAKYNLGNVKYEPKCFQQGLAGARRGAC